MVTFFTRAWDSVSRNAATPPHFTIALMLAMECGFKRAMRSGGATAYPRRMPASAAILENVRVTITGRPAFTYGIDVAYAGSSTK